MLINYGGNDFDKLIEKGLVLVDFFATWCGPCKMLAPILDEVAKKVEGTATIIKVDIDQHRPLAIEKGIRSVPTLILFKDGVEVAREVGFCEEEKLIELINKHK